MRVPGGRRPQGSGSAVSVTSDGFLLTSVRVLDRSAGGVATFADGAEAEFDVIGADPLSDLAVIRTSAGAQLRHRRAGRRRPPARRPARRHRQPARLRRGRSAPRRHQWQCISRHSRRTTPHNRLSLLVSTSDLSGWIGGRFRGPPLLGQRITRSGTRKPKACGSATADASLLPPASSVQVQGTCKESLTLTRSARLTSDWPVDTVTVTGPPPRVFLTLTRA